MRTNLLLRLSAPIAALVIMAGGARASSIVQSAYFQYSLYDTEVGSYQQFDPSLGVLDQVQISTNGGADSGEIGFDNLTAATISFTGTISLTAFTDAGGQPMSTSFAATLGPGAEIDESAGGQFSSSETFSDANELAQWIGTGALEAGQYSSTMIEPTVTVSDPNIGFFLDYPGSIGGTETVTYLYTPASFLGDPSGLPEPASWIMLATAVLCWAAVRFARR